MNSDCESWSVCACSKLCPFFTFSNVVKTDIAYCVLRVGLWYLKVTGSVDTNLAFLVGLHCESRVLLVNCMSQVLIAVFKLISLLFGQLLML
jgi:hypothetical protein